MTKTLVVAGLPAGWKSHQYTTCCCSGWLASDCKLLHVSCHCGSRGNRVGGTSFLWISICMPTGSGKSAICKFSKSLVNRARAKSGLTDADPSWCLNDQSFEKMGSLMSENHCKLLGLYDELAMFLSQINVFRGRDLSDSHELAVFLQLYGAIMGQANRCVYICIVHVLLRAVYVMDIGILPHHPLNIIVNI